MKYFVNAEERIRSGHKEYIEFQLPSEKLDWWDKDSLYMPESVMEETGFGAFWTQCMCDDIVFDQDTISLDELQSMMKAGSQSSVVLEVMEELKAWMEVHSASGCSVSWPNFQRWLEEGAVYIDRVCLFFYANGEFLVHGCSLEDAEEYGDFLIYPKSHFDIWTSYYEQQYGVEYDYFPRGRVAYCKSTGQFQVLYDRCLDDVIQTFVDAQYTGMVTLGYDEHYQCHRCNQSYVI